MRPTSPDHNGGKLLLEPLGGCLPRLKLIWAESGYKKGGFCEWVRATFGWEVEIVEHAWSGIRRVWVPEGVEPDWEKIRPSGFHVLKWRWIVERTFAWPRIMRCSPAVREAWIYIAMMRIMLRRLAQNGS